MKENPIRENTGSWERNRRQERDRAGKCFLCREFNALDTPDDGWKKAGRMPGLRGFLCQQE
ncbi:hypothetical protein PLACP1_06320 [Planifilum fimeticola]|jgi:hypothetical protein